MTPWRAAWPMVLLAAVAASAAASDATTGRVQLGLEVYAGHCGECHGEAAEGAPNWQMPDENGNLPAPPHDSTGHSWRHSDGELAAMIADGWRDPFNGSEELTMPAFADVLMPAEIEAVIAYLKTLWTPVQQQFQQQKTTETSAQSVPTNRPRGR